MTENNFAINVEGATLFLNQKEILHDINWQVKRGEKYFILGANGAGKTTLVRMLLGYIWPLYGAKVEILSKRLGKVDVNELRKSVAWVSPFISKFLKREYTGLDVVLSGMEGTLGFFREPESAEVKRACEVLSALNGLHLRDKSILHMSSGEQMKVLIARALCTNPKLMILDEPNVFLDIKERENLLAVIEKTALENPDLTMIFISQRIEDILPIFEKGMILKNGCIEATGARDEILNEEKLQSVFELDIKLVKTENNRLWAIVK